MPRTKEQFAEMRIATREKIKASAMQLFAQKGFSATSVQEIADLSGMSIGLLYKHYKTKEDLFGELVSFALIGMENLITYFSDFSYPKDKLIGFTNLIYQDMMKDDEFSNLLILMIQSVFAGNTIVNKEEITNLNSKMLSTMSDLISKGQKHGDFCAGDPYSMATHFFATIQGLAIMKIALHDTFSMPSPSILSALLLKE